MLSSSQLEALTELFRKGSDDSSAALSRWLVRPARVSIEGVDQLPLTEAASELTAPETPVCCCGMSLTGPVTGQLLLLLDDASGLALADMLMGQPNGTAREWGELEQSAFLETANILGSAYLNALARFLPGSGAAAEELLPSPPQFTRDFAESLLQFALMDQATASDTVFLTRTEFRIENSPFSCSLLLVPNAEGITALQARLPTLRDRGQ